MYWSDKVNNCVPPNDIFCLNKLWSFWAGLFTTCWSNELALNGGYRHKVWKTFSCWASVCRHGTTANACMLLSKFQAFIGCKINPACFSASLSVIDAICLSEDLGSQLESARILEVVGSSQMSGKSMDEMNGQGCRTFLYASARMFPTLPLFRQNFPFLSIKFPIGKIYRIGFQLTSSLFSEKCSGDMKVSICTG